MRHHLRFAPEPVSDLKRSAAMAMLALLTASRSAVAQPQNSAASLQDGAQPAARAGSSVLEKSKPSNLTGTQNLPPDAFRVTEQKELFGPDLSYQKWVSDSQTSTVHLVRLKLSPSGPRLSVSPESKKGRTPTDLALSESSLVSINGSFFDENLQALGLAVSQSQPWSRSRDSLGYFVFGCSADNTCSLETTAGRIGLPATANQAPGSPPFQQSFPLPSQLQTAVSGRPLLVRAGAPRSAEEDATCPQFCNTRHPRAALGMSADRSEVILALGEGRQANAQGFTLSEFAGLLKSWDVADAINLDGGGSATLVIQGTRVSGRPFGEKSERPVANVISILRPSGS